MYLKIYFEDKAAIVSHEDFVKRFHCISAAGGLVINDEGKILFIFRRGKWDLPKGKIENNESTETAAEREVKEETGLKELKLQKFICTTYHTYKEKEKEILKDTHWYQFSAPGRQELEPQTEEDITKIEWVDVSRLGNYINNTYPLIIDVLKSAGLVSNSVAEKV
jgi:8-oxo-dGTP pyrophosphatase MutT (NUDIX family)